MKGVDYEDHYLYIFSGIDIITCIYDIIRKPIIVWDGRIVLTYYQNMMWYVLLLVLESTFVCAI